MLNFFRFAPKSIVSQLLVLAVVGLANSQLSAATISFGSAVPSTGLFSNNSAWPTNGSFDFEVGVFNVGFTPTGSNVNLWLSNWNIANMGSSGSTEWLDDGGDNSFLGSGGYTTNSGPWVIGAKVYVWGFNSRSVGLNEWILFENSSSWLTVDSSSVPPQNFFTFNSGTSTVVGSTNGAGDSFQTASVSVVPEPTTWALLAASLTITTLLRRRVRRF